MGNETEVAGEQHYSQSFVENLKNELNLTTKIKETLEKQIVTLKKQIVRGF